MPTEPTFPMVPTPDDGGAVEGRATFDQPPQSLPPEAVVDAVGATSALPEPAGGASLAPGETPVGLTLDETPGRYAPPPGAPSPVLIGRGGIGQVVRVLDRATGRLVALKELQRTPDGRTSHAQAARFLREARVTAHLEHPHIVPVYELGRRPDGRYYYTMREVQGRTLTDALADCDTLPARLPFLKHFVDAANALAYAHDRGWLHRDVKPDNIMVGPFGETVVLDWGLARPLDYDAEPEDGLLSGAPDGSPAFQTRAGAVVGTPLYMAPEQAAGSATGPTPLSDVWSLGGVLHYVLTGATPRGSDALAEMSGKRPVTPIPPVRSRFPQVPAELAAIVDKALSHDPASRYASAGDLARDVDAWRNGERVQAHEYTSVELLTRFYARNRGLVWMAAALVVALLAGVVVSSLGWRAAVTERRAAEAARAAEEESSRDVHRGLALSLTDKALAARDTRDLASALVFSAWALRHEPDNPTSPWRVPVAGPAASASLALPLGIWLEAEAQRVFEARGRVLHVDSLLSTTRLTPDGRHLLVGTRGTDALYLDPIRPGDPVRLGGHGQGVEAVAISPDGRILATGDGDGALRFWDPVTHTSGGAIRVASGRIWSLDWSPDGRTVAVGADGAILALVDPLDGTFRRMPLPADPRRVAFSPDGVSVAVACIDGYSRILSMEGGSSRTVGAPSERPASLAWSPDGRLLVLGGNGPSLQVVEFSSGAVRATLPDVGNTVVLAVHPQGGVLVAANTDNRLGAFSLPDLRLLETLPAHREQVWGLAFDAAGDTLYSASWDGRVRRWGLRPVPPAVRLPGDGSDVSALAFSPDGRMLAAGSWAGDVTLWDVPGRRRLAGVRHGQGIVWDVAFSPDGRTLAVGGHDGRVSLVDGATGTVIRALEGLGARVRGVAFSADSGRLATGSGTTLATWSVADGTQIQRITAHDDTIGALAFTADGTGLLTTSWDRSVRSWDAATLARRAEFTGHTGWVSGLAVSPDARLVATSGRDTTIRLWDREGRTVAVLEGHRQWVNQVTFTPDGRYLLSSSDDGELRLWDVERRVTVLRLPHTDPLAVAVDAQGRFLAFNDADEVVLLPLEPERLVPADLLSATAVTGRTLRGVEVVEAED